ncbi:MAG TPA: SAM-dependent methyltransferase [Rhodospirillales bacterium]
MPGLFDILKARIAESGPITVAAYVEAALTDARHGYYMGRDPFGRSGDFITAPEVSQMFGELIGVWCVSGWQSVGRPKVLNLIELGPGRGTMMLDALRAARVDPAFAAAVRPALVEVSPALRARQKMTLGDVEPEPAWFVDFSETPAGPSIVLANEYFDALPARQFQMTAQGWRERLVGIGPDGGLAFTTAKQPPVGREAPRVPMKAEVGAVFETRPAADRVVRDIAGRLVAHSGLALIVDYGHAATALGDTLQAVKGHQRADPLAAPGEADLTLHVDFAALRRAAGAAGLQVFGPVDQGQWLDTLGIRLRADSLKKSAPDRAAEIDAALHRLTAADAMGRLFKALALASVGVRAPVGFH